MNNYTRWTEDKTRKEEERQRREAKKEADRLARERYNEKDQNAKKKYDLEDEAMKHQWDAEHKYDDGSYAQYEAQNMANDCWNDADNL